MAFAVGGVATVPLPRPDSQFEKRGRRRVQLCRFGRDGARRPGRQDHAVAGRTSPRSAAGTGSPSLPIAGMPIATPTTTIASCPRTMKAITFARTARRVPARPKPRGEAERSSKTDPVSRPWPVDHTVCLEERVEPSHSVATSGRLLHLGRSQRAARKRGEDVPSSVELRRRPGDVQAASSLLYSIGVTPRST